MPGRHGAAKRRLPFDKECCAALQCPSSEGPHRRAAFIYVMASSYKVDIGGLLAGGRQRLVVDQQVALEPFEGVNFPDPARVHLEMHSSGEMLELEGTVDAKYRGECDRCLGAVDREMHVDVEEQLDTQPEAQRDPFGPSNVLTGDRLDVQSLAAQLVYTEVPLNVLCGPDCKGLCPVCGENKNVGTCTCSTGDNGERNSGES